MGDGSGIGGAGSGSPGSGVGGWGPGSGRGSTGGGGWVGGGSTGGGGGWGVGEGTDASDMTAPYPMSQGVLTSSDTKVLNPKHPG